VESGKPTNAVKKRVVFSLGGGGHRYEAICLARHFAGGCSLYFITSRSSGIPHSDLVNPDRCFKISDIAKISEGNNLLLKAANALRGTFQALRIYRRIRPAVVIGVGSALSVPMLLGARLLGIKTVFVESVTRVTTPTQTGRVIAKLRLASMFYVQWPEGRGMVRGAVCKGRVI
jgi:UDP-N-acetylglucosamine:LPS N-acetylglucosamine transferase